MPRGADAYRRVEAESRSPIELVVMLYDGVLRFVADARDAQELTLNDPILNGF